MAATTRPAHPAADEELKVETEVAQVTGVTSPTSWWLLGLIALLAIAVLLFVVQFLGGSRSTDVVPGTPISATRATR